MRNAVLQITAGFASLVAAAAFAQDALSPEKLFEKLAPSVWTVNTEDAQHQPLSLGSAVVIGPGRLVTNCHVLRKAKAVSISHENVSYGATLEAPDPERDLCILAVRNFKAPAVVIGQAEDLKVGARVYAIGTPRGLEQTFSDGLVSGLRRDASGALAALQISVPISPGSSGGGLFDSHGRLVGITTSQLRDSQNVNFAVPASWLAQVPQRAQALIASRAKADATDSPRLAPAHPDTMPVFEYTVTDRHTGAQHTSAGAGELDNVAPPGGWMPGGNVPVGSWKMRHRSVVPGCTMAYDLEATVQGEETLALAGREWRTVRIALRGWIENSGGLVSARARYEGTAWLSPELGRVVRFEARARTSGNMGGASFDIDEKSELARAERG